MKNITVDFAYGVMTVALVVLLVVAFIRAIV